MLHFWYKKKANDVSERFVVPIGADKHLLNVVDLTEYDEDERDFYEKKLHDIRINYINAIKDAGLETNFRSFNMERMYEDEVQ